MGTARGPLGLTLLILLAAVCGCGYQQSGQDSAQSAGGYKWRSLYREDVHSVAVPIFTNRDFTRGVEFGLTKAVIQNLEAHTPYKVVDRDRADTILEGEIVAVRFDTLSRDIRTAVPQERLLTVTVNFTWKNLRTGHILVQRKSFDQSTTYYPTLGEGQFVGSQQAVEKLALGIVQELQAEW